MRIWQEEKVMAGMTEYKCPACGGAMEFNSSTQKLKCPYCDTEMEPEAFAEAQQDGLQTEESDWEETTESSWEAAENDQWQEEETAGMRVYVCESCGGEIVADETTGATSCPFCGNHVVMKGQFSGDRKPNGIIPFKLDRKAAKEAYQKHLKGKKFLPGIFKSENHIDEIKGVYVPFWLFDAEVKADISYRAEQVKTWRTGNKEYTERSFFDVHRGGYLSFSRIPAEASGKMDQTLMEAIEPYQAEEMVPFQPAYLAGYLADRYDISVEESAGRAEERIRKSTEDAFRETVQNYNVVNCTHSQIRVMHADYRYVLYPVWILNTTWKGRKYVFAMNGQTGKMVGDLPVDNSAKWKSIGIKTILIAAALYALQWIIMFI